MKIYIKKTALSNYELLETPDKELGKGGQARVFKIQTKGYEDYCLKKFIRQEDAQKSYDRIAYMIQNPPHNIMGSSSFRICWPTAFAYDIQKNFIGYIMPLAFPNSRDLKILEVYNAKPISKQAKYKKYPDWFDKYELDTDMGLKNRMKMLCNWAIAIYSLHETNKYVIVDLKPENVMATASGKISIVDTDSFQISENDKILFPGVAYTPGYFPPEGKFIKQNNKPFPIACDCFAAAVCFYKILTGVHPYGGTIKKAPYDELEKEDEFINAGLFAYGDKINYLSFNADFNLHKHFENLPPVIQTLFKRAFGCDAEVRPTMDEWGKVLHEAAISNMNLIRSTVKPQKINSLSIQIQDVAFCDADFDGNIIRDYGNTLYTDIAYLCPKITYKVLKACSDIELSYKIYTPSGVLMSGASSRSGFTNTVLLPCPYISSFIKDISGWGNNSKTVYAEAGTWRVEFYEDDKCLYKTSITINAKDTPKTPYNPTQKPYTATKTKKKSKSRNYLWILLLLAGIIAAAYHFWYKDYRIDQATPRTYVYATNLFLRSSKVADVDDNRLGTIPYGSELITYSNENGWAYVKADGQKGYVSSDYLLDTSDFLLLNSVWGNEEAKEVVSTAKYRLALLDYYKRAGLRGGTEWQLYTKALGAKEDNVFYSRLFNKNSPFVDFAFLLKNNQTGERRFVLYSVDNETEQPIFCHAMEAPKDAFINDIICNKRSSNVRMTVYYSNGDKTTVNVENAPVVQSRTTERPVSTSNTKSTSQNWTGGVKTARELNELGDNAYNNKQYGTALNYYNEAAKKGSDEALANLGWMTYKGLGTPVDGAIAISYLKDAVEMGNANACYYLGLLYENGVYESQLFKDRQESLRYYKLGADRGQAKAAAAYSRLKGSRSSEIDLESVTNEQLQVIPSSGLVFNQDLKGKPVTVNNPFRQRGGAYTIAFWTNNFSSRVILSAIHPDRVQGWEFPKVTFQPNGIFLLGTEDRSSVSYAIFPYDLTKLAGERHFICVICQPGVYQKEKLLYIDGQFIASLPNPQVAQSQSACPNIQIGSGLRSVFFYIKALTSQEVLKLYQASK